MPHNPYQPGDSLGDRYVITRVLRISGLGALYEARDGQPAESPARYAIKEELIQAADQAEFTRLLDQSRQRIAVLMSLDHPAMTKMLDRFVIEDRSYLVMEFVEGRDLEDILNDPGDPPSLETIWRWGVELCDALDYLHSHRPGPVVFRDIKPSNIMIDPQGHVRLVDYGIAVVLSSEEGLDTPLGTDGYAAPEQYDGVVSPAIDIYALGATLHHLLTRQDPRLEPPFTFDKRRIANLNPAAPWEFEDVVMQALAFDSRDRFASAAQMGEALRRIHARIGA